MSTLRPIAVVDAETTSLRSPWLPNGRVPWEIAIIITRHNHLLMPVGLTTIEASEADPEALRIGGWRERGSTWSYSPASRVAKARAIADVLRGKTLVGVNPDFDSETLAAFLYNHGGCEPTWHHHTIDVTVLGAYATGLPLDSRSEDVSLALGVDRADYAPAHSALADARWALAQYEAIERLGGAS